MEDIFIKISVQGGRAEKFHRQRRRADERAQNPRELAAEKQIARQPGKQHPKRNGAAATQAGQQLEQSRVANGSANAIAATLVSLMKL